MNDISEDFARFIAGTDAVRYGDFTLKSGKKSNVFFDFGRLCFGRELMKTGEFFADFIMQNSLNNVDALFGPAYKGINIAIATSIALNAKYSENIPFIYNRKVKKDHAEKGIFVGYDIDKIKNLIVLDDVITDGGTKYEMIELLSHYKHVNIAAMIVGVDRQEHDDNNELLLPLFVKKTGIQVIAITTKQKVLLQKP
jgi:orotate phosphoribosyltransferase